MIDDVHTHLVNPKSPFYRIKHEKIYVVFDKDDLSMEDLQKAFSRAEEYGYQIGFSNEAFELWLLMHFEEVRKSLSRKELGKRLSQCLKKKYKKADENQLRKISDSLCYALENSRDMGKGLDEIANPYTNICWIVREIYQVNSSNNN